MSFANNCEQGLEVVIPEFLAEELRELRNYREAAVPYVFHRNGELLKRQQVSKAYKRVLRDLKITYVPCPRS